MLDPPKAKSLNEIPRLIDAWESKCSRLSAENKQSISNDNLRRRTILKMATKELEKHMAQNGHVFKTYDLARAAMIRYAEELGTKDNHSKPMEVDANQEAGDEDEVKDDEVKTCELDAIKGGGKGQNSDFYNYCKKSGHLKD